MTSTTLWPSPPARQWTPSRNEELRMKNEELRQASMSSIVRYKREGSVLHIKSYEYAVRITKMFLHLSEIDWRLRAIYQQVLRSGTSISSNVHESEFAQSPADFISKLSIALKEANETLNWLNLFLDTEHLTEKEFESMASDCNELIALLVSSIKTTKKNNNLTN